MISKKDVVNNFSKLRVGYCRQCIPGWKEYKNLHTIECDKGGEHFSSCTKRIFQYGFARNDYFGDEDIYIASKDNYSFDNSIDYTFDFSTHVDHFEDDAPVPGDFIIFSPKKTNKGVAAEGWFKYNQKFWNIRNEVIKDTPDPNVLWKNTVSYWNFLTFCILYSLLFGKEYYNYVGEVEDSEGSYGLVSIRKKDSIDLILKDKFGISFE